MFVFCSLCVRHASSVKDLPRVRTLHNGRQLFATTPGMLYINCKCETPSEGQKTLVQRNEMVRADPTNMQRCPTSSNHFAVVQVCQIDAHNLQLLVCKLQLPGLVVFEE